MQNAKCLMHGDYRTMYLGESRQLSGWCCLVQVSCVMLVI